MNFMMLQTSALFQAIDAWDRSVTLYLNTHGPQCLDSFWLFMSAVKVWIPLYVAVVALLIWRLGWKRGLVAVACIALAFFFSERVNNLIKFLVERVRPCNDEFMLASGLRALEEGGGFSFPSGHSNNCFTFALSSLIALRTDGRKHGLYGALIMTWAALVAVSRIMVGKHYLIDIFIGALLGLAMGLLWGYIAKTLFNRVKF